MLKNYLINIMFCINILIILAVLATLQYLYIHSFFTLQDANILRIIVICIFILQVIIIFYGIEKVTNPNILIYWIVSVIFFPVFTSFIFIFLNKYKKNIIKKSEKKVISQKQSSDNNVLNYLINVKAYMPKCNSKIKYYDIGEKFFYDFINDLKNAKKYIFINFYIIAKGKMWDKIYSILDEKHKSRCGSIYYI